MGWTWWVKGVTWRALELVAQEDDCAWLKSVSPVDCKAAGPEKKPAKERGLDATAAGGAGAVATEAAKQIEPLAQTSEILQIAFVALLVVGVGLTVWSLLRRRQDD